MNPTHLLEAGYNIRTVQELLGYRDVGTTIIDNPRPEPWRSRGRKLCQPARTPSDVTCWADSLTPRESS